MRLYMHGLQLKVWSGNMNSYLYQGIAGTMAGLKDLGRRIQLTGFLCGSLVVAR